MLSSLEPRCVVGRSSGPLAKSNGVEIVPRAGRDGTDPKKKLIPQILPVLCGSRDLHESSFYTGRSYEDGFYRAVLGKRRTSPMSSPGDLRASRQEAYRSATIAMTVLAAAFVALRFIARCKKRLKIGWDDYIIVVSLVLLFGQTACNSILIHYGLGLHAATIPLENLVMFAKVLMGYECIYCTTLGVTKVSILLMYTRIFPTRPFRIAAIVLGGIAVAWVISIICVSVFQCSPIAKAWHPNLPGTCINLKGSFIGNAVPNILTDIAILSLPVPVVWGLQASPAYRLSVIGLFLLGSFVVFTSIFRFTTLFKFHPTDTTWTLGDACTWCLIESSSGIISACMPTLRPLAVMITSRLSSQLGSRFTRTTDTKASPANRSRPDNPTLRPTNEPLAKTKVQLGVAPTDGWSDDEVPLNTIMVRRDVTWQENSYSSQSR